MLQQNSLGSSSWMYRCKNIPPSKTHDPCLLQQMYKGRECYDKLSKKHSQEQHTRVKFKKQKSHRDDIKRLINTKMLRSFPKI